MLARVEQALADQAFLDLGEHRAFGLEALVLFDLLGPPRIFLGERCQIVHAGRHARGLETLRARAMFDDLLLLTRRAPGADLVDGEQDLRIERARARARRIFQKATPQHRRSGRDAVELEVVSLPGRQRLAVTVAAIGREAGEHGAIADVVQHPRRPAVGEVDDDQAARARRVRIDDALLVADDLDGAPLRRQIRSRRQHIFGAQRRRARAWRGDGRCRCRRRLAPRGAGAGGAGSPRLQASVAINTRRR